MFTIPRFISKIVLSINCYVHIVSPLLLSVDPGISVSAYKWFLSQITWTNSVTRLVLRFVRLQWFVRLQYSETRTWIIGCIIYWTYESRVKSVYNSSNEQVPYPNMFVCLSVLFTLHSSMYYAQHVFIISLLAITINGQYVWPSNYTCVGSIISLVNIIYLIMELLLKTGPN